MLFAAFLVFQVCRLDPVTQQFELSPEPPAYLEPNSLKGFQEVPSEGDLKCTRVLIDGGFTKFFVGTPAEIISRITNMEERR